MKDYLKAAMDHSPRIVHKFVDGLSYYRVMCDCGWEVKDLQLSAKKAETLWNEHYKAMMK